jgi:hypothetical protein
MSAMLCPSCKGNGFHWSVNDDNRTYWYCSLCGFFAEEDESKETVCSICGKKSSVWLMHDSLAYYWCGLFGSYQGRAA